MPHAIIEYASCLKDDFQKAGGTAMVHKVLSGAGVFDPANLKTRAYETDDFQVGLDGASGSFLHVIVYLMEGRSTEQRQGLATRLLGALKQAMTSAGQITVDIREINKDTYQKHVFNK